MRAPLALTLVACAALNLSGPAGTRAETGDLPSTLSDRAFWQLIEDASEPGGYFRNENITNLTSNEVWFQAVIPDLIARVPPGRVYLGVGPEQNFTYMAATRPAMAILFDIRRGNLDLQLMYKAIFELAHDRAEFVSILFSKPRPAAAGSNSTVAELFQAFEQVASSQALFAQNLAAIRSRLTDVHRLPLARDDLDDLETVFREFYSNGFAVRRSPRYDELMLATDEAGVARSYLASEADFRFLKNLHDRNLVIPIVGDFAGPKAIRTIGAYLTNHRATVGAFYLSNVEQYLYQAGRWDRFCRNVAALPIDGSSTFIRSQNGGRGGWNGGFWGGRGFVNSLGSIRDEISHGCGEPR